MARVLVADDRASNRELLATLLGYAGHEVVEAADGAEALAAVALAVPDLVITDLLMPNLDGEDLCRQLRADHPSLPIIIHTASYRSRQALEIAARLRVQWVMPKPADPAQVLQVVAQALGGAAAMPVAAAAPAFAAAAAGGWPDHATGVRQRNDQLTALLTHAVDLSRVQARELAREGLDQDVESLAGKLNSLLNLGLQVAGGLDTAELVERFCDTAQDVLEARYAGVALVEDGELIAFACRGLSAEQVLAMRAQAVTCEAARRLLRGGPHSRMLLASKSGDFVGLPAAHPPVQTLLAAPVSGRNGTVGWMYAADRLPDPAFGVQDERVILALGATLATAWSSRQRADQLDREVARRTRELQLAYRELESFSSIVSHDLRAPLGSIAGFAQVLDESFGHEMPPKALDFVHRIRRNASWMTSLIGDLLTFARTARVEPVLRVVDLQSLITECLDDFAEEIARRAVVVEMPPLPACRGDRALLARVFTNLLGNALKYTGRQASPRIAIACRPRGLLLDIEVSDNGAGFDMGYVDRLFQPFQRLHTTDEFPGTGIGLALVRQIVERHGGSVRAEGTPGAGACFTVSLPPA